MCFTFNTPDSYLLVFHLYTVYVNFAEKVLEGNPFNSPGVDYEDAPSSDGTQSE